MERSKIDEYIFFSLDFGLTAEDAKKGHRHVPFRSQFGLIGGRDFLLPGGLDLADKLFLGKPGYKADFNLSYGEPQRVQTPLYEASPMHYFEIFRDGSLDPVFAATKVPTFGPHFGSSFLVGLPPSQSLLHLYPTNRGEDFVRYRGDRFGICEQKSLLGLTQSYRYFGSLGLTSAKWKTLCWVAGEPWPGLGPGPIMDISSLLFSLNDISVLVANSALLYFVAPAFSHFSMAICTTDVSTLGDSLVRPQGFAVLKPSFSENPTFTLGYGATGDYGRPYTNSMMIGKSQGTIAPYGDYWIGPASNSVVELYLLSPLNAEYSSIDALIMEVLFAKNSTPDLSSLYLRLQLGTTTQDFALVSNRVGKIIVSGDFWYVGSYTLLNNPITNKSWDKNVIDLMKFGFYIPPGADYESIKIAGFNITVCLPEKNFIDSVLTTNVSTDNEYQTDPVITDEDIEKMALPHFYKFYMAIKDPTIVAEISLIRLAQSFLLDGSFEHLCQAGEGDEVAWGIITGSYLKMSTRFTPAYDGLWSISLKPSSTISQQIVIPVEEIGQSWKIGGAFSCGITSGGTVTFTLSFLDEFEVLIDSISLAIETDLTILDSWNEFVSGDIIVPISTNFAIVEINWSGTDDADLFLDSLYAGRNILTIADGRVSGYFRSIGDVYLGGIEFTSGSWDDLIPGMTLRTNLGQEIRLREVFEDERAIKVAENTIEWNGVETLSCLDEYRYWVRYPRMVFEGTADSPEEVVALRMAALNNLL